MTNVEYVETYEDDQGEWRWRGIAGNGEIVATGEEHRSSLDAARAALGVLGEGTEVRELDPEADPGDDAEEGPEPEEGPVEE